MGRPWASSGGGGFSLLSGSLSGALPPLPRPVGLCSVPHCRLSPSFLAICSPSSYENTLTKASSCTHFSSGPLAARSTRLLPLTVVFAPSSSRSVPSSLLLTSLQYTPTSHLPPLVAAPVALLILHLPLTVTVASLLASVSLPLLFLGAALPGWPDSEGLGRVPASEAPLGEAEGVGAPLHTATGKHHSQAS